MPMLLCKDARTGKITVFVIATGSNVKEAVYVPKSMVFKLEPIRYKGISSHYASVTY
jgi:hypothetical protein